MFGFCCANLSTRGRSSPWLPGEVRLVQNWRETFSARRAGVAVAAPGLAAVPPAQAASNPPPPAAPSTAAMPPTTRRRVACGVLHDGERGSLVAMTSPDIGFVGVGGDWWYRRARLAPQQTVRAAMAVGGKKSIRQHHQAQGRHAPTVLEWLWRLLGTLRVLPRDRHALLVEHLLLR